MGRSHGSACEAALGDRDPGRAAGCRWRCRCGRDAGCQEERGSRRQGAGHDARVRLGRVGDRRVETASAVASRFRHDAAGQSGDGQGQGLGRRAPDHRARGRLRHGRAASRSRRYGGPGSAGAGTTGAVAIGARAVRARRQDQRDEPEAPETELHLAERVRQRRVELRSRERQRAGSRGAVARGAECAARRHCHVAAFGNRRQAPRAARRKGGVRFAAGHGRRPEEHGTAGARALRRHSGVEARHDGGPGRRRLRRPEIHRTHRAHQPRDRSRHARHPGLRRHSESRAGSARRHVRHRQDRPRRGRAGRDTAGHRRSHGGRADVRVDDPGRQARQADRAGRTAR